MVKEEKDRDDQSRDDGSTNPSYIQVPEPHKEVVSTRIRGCEASTDGEIDTIQRSKLPGLRDSNEDDDTDCCRVLAQTKANVAMEEGFPMLGRVENHGKDERADRADDGV